MSWHWRHEQNVLCVATLFTCKIIYFVIQFFNIRVRWDCIYENFLGGRIYNPLVVSFVAPVSEKGFYIFELRFLVWVLFLNGCLWEGWIHCIVNEPLRGTNIHILTLFKFTIKYPFHHCHVLSIFTQNASLFHYIHPHSYISDFFGGEVLLLWTYQIPSSGR